MRYSTLAGGKRLRAILALMAGKMIARPQSVPHLRSRATSRTYAGCWSAKESAIMPAACALELVHTYSLIHDDLPAMDNDDCRRGKPTSHKVFGEGMAILAGDALLTYAFQLIAQKTADKKIVPTLVAELAQAAGSVGMVGGQVLDIGATGKNKPLSPLCLCGEIH
ncbi:MAG: polyprenyl synthetase family protein, partial [Planctomycetes bacterium]|nr:polyprenyl synthetase family protein [Planctomycetota bacterium]